MCKENEDLINKNGAVHLQREHQPINQEIQEVRDIQNIHEDHEPIMQEQGMVQINNEQWELVNADELNAAPIAAERLAYQRPITAESIVTEPPIDEAAGLSDKQKEKLLNNAKKRIREAHKKGYKNATSQTMPLLKAFQEKQKEFLKKGSVEISITKLSQIEIPENLFVAKLNDKQKTFDLAKAMEIQDAMDRISRYALENPNGLALLPPKTKARCERLLSYRINFEYLLNMCMMANGLQKDGRSLDSGLMIKDARFKLPGCMAVWEKQLREQKENEENQIAKDRSERKLQADQLFMQEEHGSILHINGENADEVMKNLYAAVDLLTDRVFHEKRENWPKYAAELKTLNAAVKHHLRTTKNNAENIPKNSDPSLKRCISLDSLDSFVQGMVMKRAVDSGWVPEREMLSQELLNNALDQNGQITKESLWKYSECVMKNHHFEIQMMESKWKLRELGKEQEKLTETYRLVSDRPLQLDGDSFSKLASQSLLPREKAAFSRNTLISKQYERINAQSDSNLKLQWSGLSGPISRDIGAMLGDIYEDVSDEQLVQTMNAFSVLYNDQLHHENHIAMTHEEAETVITDVFDRYYEFMRGDVMEMEKQDSPVTLPGTVDYMARYIFPLFRKCQTMSEIANLSPELMEKLDRNKLSWAMGISSYVEGMKLLFNGIQNEYLEHDNKSWIEYKAKYGMKMESLKNPSVMDKFRKIGEFRVEEEIGKRRLTIDSTIKEESKRRNNQN